MSLIIMLIIGVISIAFVVNYFLIGRSYQMQGKDKKTISNELVELLKE